MSEKGTFGNQSIITLVSGDERRHKVWCVFYRKEDRFCTECICKCMGAAHCSYYKKKAGVGPLDAPVKKVLDPGLPPKPEVSRNSGGKQVPAPEHTSSSGLVPDYIRVHRPSFDEKLTGKVVLMKNTCGHIMIGAIVADNGEIFTFESDDGQIVKYERKTAIVKGKSILVVDDETVYALRTDGDPV